MWHFYLISCIKMSVVCWLVSCISRQIARHVTDQSASRALVGGQSQWLLRVASSQAVSAEQLMLRSGHFPRFCHNHPQYITTRISLKLFHKTTIKISTPTWKTGILYECIIYFFVHLFIHTVRHSPLVWLVRNENYVYIAEWVYLVVGRGSRRIARMVEMT